MKTCINIFLVGATLLLISCGPSASEKNKAQAEVDSIQQANSYEMDRLDGLVDSINELNLGLLKEKLTINPEKFDSLMGENAYSEKYLRDKQQLRRCEKDFYGHNDVSPIDSRSLDSRIIQATHAVCAIIPRSVMTLDPGSATYTLDCGIIAEQNIDQSGLTLCSTESYRDEINPAIGTGWAFKKDVVITTRHSFNTNVKVQDCYLVFDFVDNKRSILASNVYKINSIIPKRPEDAGLDFMLLRTDRQIPFSLEKRISEFPGIAEQEKVYMLGHPMGLPMKYTPNGTVYIMTDTELKTNLDAYHGNSGSPVFNAITHNLIGILYKGDTDYEKSDNGCMISFPHPDYNKDREFIGETVLRLNTILNKY